MKWYLLALIMVPAIFVLLDLVMRRVDAWMARHRAASYFALALLGAAMVAARLLGGVHRVGEWLLLSAWSCFLVYFVIKALRARSDQVDHGAAA